MNRRAFVAASAGALSVALAGCATVAGSRRLFVEPFDPNHVAYRLADLAPERRAAIETIRDEGAAITYGHRRFTRPGEKAYLELDGDFYRIETDETGETVLIRDILYAELDTSEAAAADAVAPEDAYDEADQRRISQAAEHAFRPEQRYSPYIFRDVRSDETDLRPEPSFEYVELTTDRPWGQERVIHLHIGSSMVAETEYATTIRRVADAAEEFAGHLDDAGLVSRVDGAELTPDQRDALEAAVADGTYDERRPLFVDDGPFDGLPVDPKRDPETDRPYRILRYDGEYYAWAVEYTDGDV